MLHVGPDAHGTRITTRVLNGRGRVAHRAQVRTTEEVLAAPTGPPDRSEVCYEAGCGYGHYHDPLRPPAARVLVAHPGQPRLIVRSEHKSGRNGADRLAELLCPGETPAVRVPAPAVRARRELIDCRGQPAAERTRAEDGARGLLRGAGVAPPGKPGLWAKGGPARLRRVGLPAASRRRRRDLLLEEIEAPAGPARRVEQEPGRQARRAPAVALLRTTPGVGARTAEAAASADGPHRPRRAEAVGRYSGLVPGRDQPGDRDRPGHTAREGPPVVRQVAAGAARPAARRPPAVRAVLDRARRDDPQRQEIAPVATAHYPVRVMWAVLRRGTARQGSRAGAA